MGLMPRASGASGVRDYESLEPEARAQALREPEEHRVDKNLMQRAREFAEIPQRDQVELSQASGRVLSRSAAFDYLPQEWSALTRDVRTLNRSKLLHPQHPALSQLARKPWWNDLLMQDETWLTYAPLHPGLAPSLTLIQSPVGPEAGDRLVLASMWQMAELRDAKQDRLKAYAQVNIPVVWSSLLVEKDELDLVALGALVDRAFFCVLPGLSRLAGLKEQ